jgi:uncharacterized membrane protein
MNLLKQLFTNRPRLSVAFLLGGGIFFILPAGWPYLSRALTAWNVAVWGYLILMGWLMVRANHDNIRTIAQREFEGAITVLVVLSLAAIVSLVAIIWQLAFMKNMPAEQRFFSDVLTGFTVLGAWILLATIFTFHYALLYYLSPAKDRSLRFPDHSLMPDYWDFLYFAFTIAVAAQTSDVVVTSRAMRKTVLAQSVLSFFFNAAILGFSINIAASVVGS